MMKTIYISDLAQQYFPTSTPHTATVMLRRWFKQNKALCRRLEALDYQRGQRILTPRQHAAVRDELGEPE
jgi:hypothetical protein